MLAAAFWNQVRQSRLRFKPVSLGYLKRSVDAQHCIPPDRLQWASPTSAVV